MKLVHALLPLATILTVGSVGLYAIQAPLLFVPPPAPASKPLASPPAPPAAPLASPPAAPAKPFALPPFSSPRVFVLPPRSAPTSKGPQTLWPSMIQIPHCYFVSGLQSLGGVIRFTDQAGHPLPVPASPRDLFSAGRPPAPR